MRPLKRPMFKYGGDVKKQGIMHGMNGLRDGGVATTMADATGYAGGGMTMPNMRGRVTGPGGYAGKTSIADKARAIYTHPYAQRGIAMGEGAGMFEIFKHLMGMKEGGIVNLANGGMPNKRGLVDGPGGYAGIDPRKRILSVLPGFEKIASATKGSIPKIYQGIKDIYARRGTGFKPSLPKVPGTPGKEMVPFGQISGKVTQNVNRAAPKSIKDAFKYAGELAIANPKTTALVAPLVPGAALAKLPFGIADTAIESYLGAEPFGIVGGKEKYRNIKKSVSDLFKKDKKDGDDKILTEEQKQIKALQDQIAAMNKKKTITGKPEPTEEDKLKRIYSLLGVDRAQRGAASKALADMSRYIDEGGKDTISRKNIGSTLTKGILAFDKRLDKVDQLKEAAGLMMAKGEIEAMSNPLDKEYKQVMIDSKKREMNPTVLDQKLALDLKGQTLTHDRAATIAKRTFPNAVVLADAKKAKEEGIGDEKTVVEYVSEQIKTQGGSVAGVYVVDKSIIQVDAQGNIKQII